MYVMFHIFSLKFGFLKRACTNEKTHSTKRYCLSNDSGVIFTLVSTSFSVSKMIGESLLLQYSVENVSIQVQPSGMAVL